MKTYEIIYLSARIKSFSWMNGLFAVIDIVDNEYHLCKLTERGELTLNDDGSFMVTVSGVKGGIEKTNLKIEHNG